LFCHHTAYALVRIGSPIFFIFTEQPFCNLSGGGKPHHRRNHDMLNQDFMRSLLAATLALGLSGAGSVAEAAETLAFAKEVDSCVAAVTSRLDLDRATRVRHLVSTAKQTGIGYVLTIETAVFFDSSEKKYEAYCVANGDNAPLKFRIEEIDI
jgi:hypothetical protein